MSDKTFIVVGYYPDTEQRFTDSVEASSHEEAEKLSLHGNPGLNVVASFYLDTDDNGEPRHNWGKETYIRT